ncbi:MAG: iron-regulated protein [Planctomycetes bacterium]|nr:iron-regulated protein [Planctomycetota bacterium]
MRSLLHWIPLTLLGLTAACAGTDTEGAELNTAMISARGSYADLMFANYSDLVGLVTSLQTSVDTYVAAPDAPNLQAAKDAWNLARPYYEQAEVARFYGGPIDALHGDLNAAPIDGLYIDYVVGDANSGIINDAAGFPTIDDVVLRGANGVGSAFNVASGWHAAEFLLWGEDLDVNGPGARPFVDYTATLNFARRVTYLEVVASMLVDDMTALRDEWAPNTGTYRTQFLTASAGTGVTRALSGMATLGLSELRNERILIPYTSQDEGDEHSNFSDTTHLDLINNGIGIRNIWTGTYDAFDNAFDYDGFGMDDLFVVGDAASGVTVTNSINALVVALQAQVTPFDAAILGADTVPGRLALLACMDRLNDFNVAMLAGGSALGLTVTSN